MRLSVVGAVVFTIAYWLGVAALAVLGAKYLPVPGGWGAVVVLVLGVAPSALVRYAWRDHFRGRRLLNEGKPVEAERAFNAFREAYAQNPWLRRLEWLAVFHTTRNFEAMTWNNIGVAQLEQARAKDALLSFELALLKDAGYRVARCNAVFAARAARDEARQTLHREALLAEGVTDDEVRRMIADFDTRRRARTDGGDMP